MGHRTSFSTRRWWVAVDSIEDLLEEIIGHGSRLVSEVECYYSEDRTVSVGLRKREVATATESAGSVLSIRTISGGKIGVSTTNDPTRWKECLAAAIESGKAATQQTWGGLPAQSTVDTAIASYDPAVEPGVEPATQIISGMLEGAAEYPVDISSGGADLSIGTVWIANSRGALYSRMETGVSCSLETISGQSTGSEFDQSYSLRIDPVKVGRQAAFLATHSLDALDIATGSYDVVLSPIAFAQLLSYVVIPALSGRNVHAGRSRLAGRIGTTVMDPSIQLFDDPFAENGLGRTSWDAEGVPTTRLDFVRDGVLQGFSFDLKTAYRYGSKSTASAVRGGAGGGPSIGSHNFVVDGPRSEIHDEPAVYVQDVVGAHTANPMSGDFSVECQNASWVEGGGYGKAIRKSMLAGNVFEMLGEIGGLGKESRVIGGLILPAIRLHSQRIVGKD